MAANTGPDLNTYSIPEVALGDTFNTWRDVTNTGVYKLNKLKIYDGVSSSSIDITVAAGGTLSAAIADNVNKGVTFLQPVTFNGDVTFNASAFTVNANIVTIDDYSIVLGDTAAGSDDTKITAAGGGGLLINRGTSGNTAEWLWRPTEVHGLTGVWQGNAHLGFSGATFGIYPHQGGVLPVHGSGIRLDGGSTSDHGLLVELTSSGAAGTTSNRSIQFERYAPAGSTVFMEVLSGDTYGTRPFVNISDGANRKTIYKSGHGFVFGTPVRFDGSTYVAAQASSAESAEVVGIVSKVINTDYFEITFLGEIFGDFSLVNATNSSLVSGTTYYLTPGDAGKITPVQPTSPGAVHKALLIATGANSAIVLPFTGGVLSSPIQIANSSSVATRINQINAFKVGDLVRFKAYPAGITLRYNDGISNITQYFSEGIFVKAQADTAEEAEVAGMVIATGLSGASMASNFDVLMDGFFNVSSWSSPYGTLTPGTVYFLNSGCAGTTQSFESNVSSHSTTPPSTEGTVRKPLFMATSAFSGYLFSYRGDVRGAATGVSYANLENFLVYNISDGVSGDLKIGVYNASTTGLECIKLAAGQGKYDSSVGVTGYVGIGGGWQALNTGTGNRILSQLDVRGDLRVGVTLAGTAQGRDLIISRYTTDSISSNGTTAATRNVIGTQYQSSSLVLGYGVRPGRNSDSWISSLPGSPSSPRSVLIAGASGGTPALVWKTAESDSVALGSAVTLTDGFSIIGNTASFAGSMNIGTTYDVVSDNSVFGSNSPRVVVQGYGQKSSRSQICCRTNDGNFILLNASGKQYDYSPINAYDGGGYLVFGRVGGANQGCTFGINPWAAGATNGMLFAFNGTNLNVGINNQNPLVALDVNGEARSSTSTTSGANAKTLTTKDYVDDRMKVGTVVTFMIANGGFAVEGSAHTDQNDYEGMPDGWKNVSVYANGEVVKFTVPANSGNWRGCAVGNDGLGSGSVVPFTISDSASIQTVTVNVPYNNSVWFFRARRTS
jgi:hypothetical protein